ncbi:MAG TPA: LacI family DNA-binding transcriptional regulator [Candidatus Merdenecus merdavium]|nr:LacI family DNA-binding transcriptional regulator [Candidatus Merdenecus merdavium]
MAITIKDVAKETNLAISTISKYINGGSVRPENKKVIDEAISRLGYHPNKAARGLRGVHTFTIGLLMDSLESQYYAVITENIEWILKEKGYSLIVCCHKDCANTAKQRLEFLVERQVDGIIMVPLASELNYMKDVLKSGIPIVAIDRYPNAPCDTVASNAVTGAYAAVEYLIRCGHKKIGIISGTDRSNPGIDTAKDRLKGYYRAFEDYRIEVIEEFVKKGDFKFDSGYECMESLWNLREKPTAIFVANYNMALGAMTAIHNLKIKVPEELSFVSYDDLEFSYLSNPNLTAVRQPAEKVAKESIELLLKRIAGDHSSYPKYIRIPTTLHIRDSVKKMDD